MESEFCHDSLFITSNEYKRNKQSAPPSPSPPDLVIAGGGTVGCELALHLSEKGHGVTILGMTDRLGAQYVPIAQGHQGGHLGGRTVRKVDLRRI